MIPEEGDGHLMTAGLLLSRVHLPGDYELFQYFTIYFQIAVEKALF